MANVFLSAFPMTEEGAKLELSNEVRENCRVVYKLDDKGGAAFSELWDSEKGYSEEFVILPFTSIYNKLTDTEYGTGTHFANIIGSTVDKPDNNKNKHWIDLLIKVYDGSGYDPSTCCTDGAIYDSATGAAYTGAVNVGFKIINPFSCGGGMVGGHILLNRQDADNPDSTTVHILPICGNHNLAHKNGKAWGVGYFIKLGRPMKAVEMTGYIGPVKLQNYLNSIQK